MADTYFTGLLPQSHFRYTMIDCSDLCSHLSRIHNLDDRMVNFLSKTLMGAFFLARMVKGDQRISIQWKDESKQSVLAYSNRLGAMKGVAYSGDPEYYDDVRHQFIYGTGILKVIRWKLDADPYTSFTHLEEDTFETNLKKYIQDSEQVQTSIYMDTNIPRDGYVEAKGIFLQALPEATEEDRERIVQLADRKIPVEAFFQMPLREIQDQLSEIFQEPIQALDSGQPHFQCDCSRSKIMEVLVSLGEKEVREILTEQGKVEVECEFCKSLYDFEKPHIDRLFPH